MFRNVAELLEQANADSISISEVMIRQEMDIHQRSREEVMGQMERNLQIMEEAVERGLKGVTSHSGLTGNDAVLLQQYMAKGNTLSGHLLLDAVSKAVATNEVNAAMGMNLRHTNSRKCGLCAGSVIRC